MDSDKTAVGLKLFAAYFDLGDFLGDMETPQHGNASTRKCLKKQNHKTNLMSSSLIKKINNYFTINLG